MHAFLLMSVLMAEPTSTSIPIGKSMVEARFGEVSLKLFTYKPPNYSTGPMLMVFHGVLRNADEYRDDSVEMGDRFRALIVAPLFDETVFRCFPFFQTDTQRERNLGVMKRYIAGTATEAQKHDVAPLISL